MALIERLFTRSATPTPGGPGARRSLAALLGGEGTAAGVSVSEEGSLRLSAVYACVRVLAETVAQLPLFVYEREERGKRRAVEHWLYPVLHKRPNEIMTAFEFWETMMGHVCLWGNGYAEIEYDGGGRVLGLWPLRPDMVTEIRRTGEGLAYVYQLPDGKQTVLRGENVFHVRGLSPDGIRGYSPIGMQRQLVGMGLATEAFGANFFRNGARPGGILEHPGVLDDEAFDRLRETWNETHGGLSNSHRLAILEEGMTYRQIGVPPEEAQFLESMKFNRSQIASIFRVPPHMIGDLDKATFSNIEQQSIEFKVFTMEPWLVRLQQAIDVRLIGDESGRYFAEFLPDALLRGDTISRYQAHSIGRQNGWLSANDIRGIENLNPIEGGDVYLVPLNMVPAGDGGEGESDQSPVNSEEGRSVASGQWSVASKEGEIRAEQMEAARARHGLQVAYLPMFEDVAGRVVRREANDIGNASRRLLGKGKVDEFLRWLGEFWGEHVDYVERQYGPLMRSYAALVGELAAKEVGSEDVPAVDEFLEAYTRAAAERHVGRREARLLRVMYEAGEKGSRGERAQGSGGEEEEEGIDEQIAAQQAAIDELLAHWREVEPGRTAREESVRGNNALALAFYGALLVSRKTWVTFGDNCPYCDSLKGRTVDLNAFYLSAGQSFLPIGAEVPLVLSVNVGHAPAHEGCDCMVVAG